MRSDGPWRRRAANGVRSKAESVRTCAWGPGPLVAVPAPVKGRGPEQEVVPAQEVSCPETQDLETQDPASQARPALGP
jgi:hypothetical protein